jgi:hypothetical protein
MTVKVNFTSPGKTAVYREFPISGGEVTLDNGTWDAEVKAYNSEPRLRGIANTSFQVNGSGQVDIRIGSAVGVKTEAQLVEALDGSGQYYDSDPANENLILLEDDIDLTGSMINTAPGNFVIAAEPGASRTISRAWGAFTIGRGTGSSGYSLTLGKEGTGTLIVDGRGVDSGTGSALFYADGGRMTIKDGVEIKDVVYDYNRGAAIWVHNGGSLDMRGGNISGCEADYGAAISVEGAGAVFTMSGGEISGNTAGGAGAVCLEGDASFIPPPSKFTMSGGKISGNRAVNGNGGAVEVAFHAELTMSGGEISGNRAFNNGNGGALCLNSGTEFTMSGGKISGNRADGGDGGAVYIRSNDSIIEFTMSGGEISGNTAVNGGGVFLTSVAQRGNFTMNGGTISGNRATGQGGGVYVDYLSYAATCFAKQGGTITGDNTDTGGPSAAYTVLGSYTRTTTAGPGDRLYVDNWVAPSNYFIKIGKPPALPGDSKSLTFTGVLKVFKFIQNRML